MVVSDIPSTLALLGKTGLSTDSIGYNLYLYQQLPCNIVSHRVPNSTSDSGIYYIEGDVTDFISGYTNFWVEGRSLESENIFTVNSSEYIQDDLWTKVVVTYSSTYKVQSIDDGKHICGRFDVAGSNRLKDLGNTISQMFESGSLGNVAFDQFDFELNDEDRAFYDKVNQSGYFYAKDLFTEVESIQSETDYSPKSGLMNTWVRVKNLDEYNGGDFKFGWLEMVTGKAAGNKFQVLDTNGYSFKVANGLSKSYKDSEHYPIPVKIADKVRIFKSDVFWVNFEIWARTALSEKFSVFSGKIDLSTVTTNDLARTLKVKAYSITKDLTSKSISDLHFDSGSYLPRLKELSVKYLDANLNRIVNISRQEMENSLQSISIAEVGFDVSEGIHQIDYYPGGLFRFDFGKWYHVVDEGSFEESTNSVFLASNEISMKDSYPAVLPDHSLTNDSINEIEKKWNGGWCRIVISTEEAQFIGSTNMTINNGTKQYKKLSGLPSSPAKVLFRVHSDHTISDVNMYSYIFDNGNPIVPPYMFDLVMVNNLTVGVSTDRTFDTVLGRKKNFVYTDNFFTDTAYPWKYEEGSTEQTLQLYSFHKFNGIELLFRNEKYETGGLEYSSGYGSLIAKSIQHMSIHFSNGSGWKGNINVNYAGAVAATDGSKSAFTIDLGESISRAGGINGEYGDYQTNMVGMKILCISSSYPDNFLQVKDILTVTQNATDSYGTLLDITTEEFDNPIYTRDRFVIINKNFNIKFRDFGDGFKAGMVPDVAAIYKPKHTTSGKYFLILKSLHPVLVEPQNLENLDVMYVGHRHKFNTIDISLTSLMSTDDDLDVAWFLKEDDFIVEYYNGVDWVQASSVTIQPTTLVGVNDDNTTYNVTDDDNVKYTITFEAEDMHTGGYNSLQYAVTDSGSPSKIDESDIYIVRITIVSDITTMLSNVSVSNITDLNMSVIWEDIAGWTKNTVEIEEGKYWADTLELADVALDMYGIELQCRQALTWLRQAKPISKLEGAIGDKLYVSIAYTEIDKTFADDGIIVDKDKVNNYSIIPRNINYVNFLEQMVNSLGLSNSKDFRLHLDTFSNPDKNYLNMIGSKYDGIKPFDVGWDRAYTPELLNDYINAEVNEYSGFYKKEISVVRANGRFYLYCVRVNYPMVDLYESTDMKNWVSVASKTYPYHRIVGLKVVKNRDDDTFAWYITYSPSSSDTRTRIGYGEISSAITFPTSITDIISDASYNFGGIDVLHLKGKCSDTTGAYRFAVVVMYDNTTVDANGYPTGTSALYAYKNEATISNSADWSYSSTLPGNGTEPVLLKGNFVYNDGTLTENAHLNQIVAIFKGTDNKLYKTAIIPDKSIEYGWDYASVISDDTISLIGLAAVVDGYTYSLMLDEAREAYTLVPTFRDTFVLYGVDTTGYVKAFSINKSISDFNEELFWLDKTQEMNEVDWFKSETGRITISDAYNTNGMHKRIYLGLREPFNKILPKFVSISYQNRCLLRYWDGINWQNFSNIFQNGRTITDSKFNPIFGFYFSKPKDWVSDIFTNIIGNYTYTGLDKNTPSLYWVEISLPSGYSSNKEIELKSFMNCYTSLFLWKNRALYIMKNWDYIRPIFTIPGDDNIGIKVSNISYDKMGKLITVNTEEDNNYGVTEADTYVLDVFGKFKKSYPVWKNGYINSSSGTKYDEYDFISQVRPNHLVRIGKENEYTIGSSSRFAMLFGNWDLDFLKEIYGASALVTGYINKSGYNLPIPFEQLVSKHWIRNTDWTVDGDNIIQNIWLARRLGIDGVPIYSAASIYQYSNSYAYLISSLTQSGLLHEELINRPLIKLPAGYYAGLEKSILTKYESVTTDIEGIVDTTYPTPTVDGQMWLIRDSGSGLHSDWINNNNSFLYCVHASTPTWSYIRPNRNMLIKDSSDSKLYLWLGYAWEEQTDTTVWGGRTYASTHAHIWLEWNVGSEGVDVSYFRDNDIRPMPFLNNNTNRIYDKKLLRTYRDIPQSIYTNDPFGGPDSSYIADNLKATCSVILPDLSSIKNSYGDTSVTENDGYITSTVKVQELSSPAFAFGMYAMSDDFENSASVPRDDAGISVNPFAYPAIGLFKPLGRVKNWLKALYYDGSAYSDITNNMNYKTFGNDYDIATSSGKYVYFCSQTRFFSLSVSFKSYNKPLLQYLKVDNTWQSTVYHTESNFEPLRSGTDNWDYKTNCNYINIDPLKTDWGKMTFQGTEGYWIRMELNSMFPTSNLQWAVLSGTMLWDSMRWWEDYDIDSNNKPIGTLTDTDKRFFDTYIPMSIEYDIVNKKLIGSFWNYDPNVNEYYPFRIPFDREELYNDSGEYYWSWDNQEKIGIIDSADYNYTKNIKSIASVSHTDAKALLMDDNSRSQPILANIKSLKTGDKLFGFSIVS